MSEKPTEQDRKNYDFDPSTGEYHNRPEEFAAEGDLVRAKFRIWDTPKVALGEMDDGNWGGVVAEAGEIGRVLHVETGFWPHVRFENGGQSVVCEFEVEKIVTHQALERLSIYES